MLLADWTVAGDNAAFIPNTPANIEELLRAPRLRATSVVEFKSVRGVLVEGWGQRTLTVGTGGAVQRPDGTWDLAFTTFTPRIEGDVVFIFFDDASSDRTNRRKFYGIAPARGFAKIADLP